MFDGIPQLAPQVFVGCLDLDQIRALFLDVGLVVLDQRVQLVRQLVVGVDDERPPSLVFEDSRVLDHEHVVGQVDLLEELFVLCGREGNSQVCVELVVPQLVGPEDRLDLLGHLVADFLVVEAVLGQECCGQDAVADHLVGERLVPLHARLPARPLPAQPVLDRLALLHLLVCDMHFLFQFVGFDAEPFDVRVALPFLLQQVAESDFVFFEHLLLGFQL